MTMPSHAAECLRRVLPFLLLIAAFAGLPLVLSQFHQLLLIEAILYGLFAMSLDVTLGYTGLVSFGHAAFFGVGGYAMGLFLSKIQSSFWPALLFSGGVVVALSLFIGYVSIRAQGIFFAILTLGFAEVIFRIIFNTHYFGGSDGLRNIPIPDIPLGIVSIKIADPFVFYYFVLGFALLAFGINLRFVKSPFGSVLKAIRENEHRVSFIGYHIKRFKMVSFAFSALFAGLSGALFTAFKGFADPEQLHFLLSGKGIIMALIGGMGTLIGPILGGIFLTIFETIISSYTSAHLIITGSVFIVMVIFLPKGVWGLISRK